MADYNSDEEEEVYQPTRSKRLKTGKDDNVKRLIIVLENAQLETAKVSSFLLVSFRIGSEIVSF